MSIVYSQSLLLSPGGIDLNAGIVGWKSLVTFTTIEADSEDGSFPAINMANPATTYRWQSLSTTTQYVYVDVPADEMVDYVGIARHNLGSDQVRVTTQALIGGSWIDQTTPMVPSNDAPLILRFSAVMADRFRIKLEPLGGVAPTIAVLYLGKLLVFQRRTYVGHTPLPYGREIDFTNNVAESGDFQGRVELRKRLQTDVSLQNLTPGWYREYMDPFIELGRSRPFFFAWRPQSYPKEVGYAWIKNNPKPVNQRANGMMQISLSLGGLVL